MIFFIDRTTYIPFTFYLAPYIFAIRLHIACLYFSVKFIYFKEPWATLLQRIILSPFLFLMENEKGISAFFIRPLYRKKFPCYLFILSRHPSSVLQTREESIMEILDGHRWNSCSESDSDEYPVFKIVENVVDWYLMKSLLREKNAYMSWS